MNNWQEYISNLSEISAKLDQQRIICVGATPYSKIVPSLFLSNYGIYSLRDCKEVALLRNRCRVYSMEEKFPDLLIEVNNVTRLVHRKEFLYYFLGGQKKPIALLFSSVTDSLRYSMLQRNCQIIGNTSPGSGKASDKLYFRLLLKRLNIPAPRSLHLKRSDFVRSDFNKLQKQFNGVFVCQRGGETHEGEGGGTIYVRSREDFERGKEVLSKPGERSRDILISEFISGNPVSKLGCVVKDYKRKITMVFTSPLQTQLIDIPEILQGQPPMGKFMGHDWGLCDWPEEIEDEADRVVQVIGNRLHSELGFRGIFGVDLIYNKECNQIYVTECNPRFTGSLPFAMLICIQHGLPPFELFHICEFLGFRLQFVDGAYNNLNRLYKQFLPASHLYINAADAVDEMRPELEPGIYAFDGGRKLDYLRSGLFPWDIKHSAEILLIDSVFRKGQKLHKGSRVFQVFSPHSIAESSFKLRPYYQNLASYLTARLLQG